MRGGCGRDHNVANGRCKYRVLANEGECHTQLALGQNEIRPNKHNDAGRAGRLMMMMMRVKNVTATKS